MKHGQFSLTANDDRARWEHDMATRHGCLYWDGRCLVHDETLDMTPTEMQQWRGVAPPKQRDTVKWKHKNY